MRGLRLSNAAVGCKKTVNFSKNLFEEVHTAMKRLIPVCVMILCLMSFVAAADEISWEQWEQSKAYVQQEAADAHPGWKISAADVYGSGTWHDETALYVDVLLHRVEDSTLYFLRLHVLANPIREGEPIEWHEEHFAPVPLDTGSVTDISESIPRLIYPEDAGTPWLSSPSGCAAFMLREGERWEDLGAMSDELIGVAVDAQGRKGLRIAKWNGSAYGDVAASPMTEADFDLDTFHSGDGFLIVDLSDSNYENEAYAYISRNDDGTWSWIGVNTGHAVYIFCDAYMLDDTYTFNGSNACLHYGCLTLPTRLEELDFSRMNLRGPKLAAFLDAGSWACVRENETPMYTAPDGEAAALCYARLAGTIVAEEDGWICLQIGSEERGLRGWFHREDLAFGAATEDVRCGFPEYETESIEPYPWRKNLAAFVNKVLDCPYGALDVDDDFGSVWIIGRAPDGRWLMEIDEDVVAFTRTDIEIVTQPVSDITTPFDDEKKEMLQSVQIDGAY